MESELYGILFGSEQDDPARMSAYELLRTEPRARRPMPRQMRPQAGPTRAQTTYGGQQGDVSRMHGFHADEARDRWLHGRTVADRLRGGATLAAETLGLPSVMAEAESLGRGDWGSAAQEAPGALLTAAGPALGLFGRRAPVAPPRAAEAPPARLPAFPERPPTRASDGSVLPARPQQPFRRTEARSSDLSEAARMRRATPDAGSARGRQTFYRGISDGREETGFYTDQRATATAYSERGDNPTVLERTINTEGFRDIPFSSETFVEAVADADRRNLPGLIVRGVPDVSGYETQIYVRDKGRLSLAQALPDGGAGHQGANWVDAWHGGERGMTELYSDSSFATDPAHAQMYADTFTSGGEVYPRQVNTQGFPRINLFGRRYDGPGGARESMDSTIARLRSEGAPGVIFENVDDSGALRTEIVPFEKGRVRNAPAVSTRPPQEPLAASAGGVPIPQVVRRDFQRAGQVVRDGYRQFQREAVSPAPRRQAFQGPGGKFAALSRGVGPEMRSPGSAPAGILQTPRGASQQSAIDPRIIMGGGALATFPTGAATAALVKQNTDEAAITERMGYLNRLNAEELKRLRNARGPYTNPGRLDPNRTIYPGPDELMLPNPGYAVHPFTGRPLPAPR